MDKRPDPKPKKHATLWQSYLFWDELQRMRIRHGNRLSSAVAGKTRMDAKTEETIISWASEAETHAQKTMVNLGTEVGPIWYWLISIKGIGDHTAAKLLALFDDVAEFSTVSKFWRYAGYGLYDYWCDKNGKPMAPKIGDKVVDGKRVPTPAIPEPDWHLETHKDMRMTGWALPYNNTLKKECYLVTEHFIRQQTPGYIDVYYEEKARIKSEHPEPEPDTSSNWPTKYTPSHIDRMARRKMLKIFLSLMWSSWRESEGLPVTLPYVLAHMDHEHLVEL